MQRWWISVALLLMLAPTALAARDDVDVRAEGKLSVVASGSAKLRHEWDWGDGEQSVGAHARHTYREPGIYKVAVTITDEHGERWRRVREVEVHAPPPRASWDVEIEHDGRHDGRVDAKADVDARAKVAWDWGDGETSRGRRATHTYEASGTYVVTMTVTERDGERWSDTRRVRVDIEDEHEDHDHDRSWTVRADVGRVDVHAGHRHERAAEDDDGAWSARYGAYSETRIESSSYDRHDVPAPGAALAIGGAGLGAILLARRKHAR